MSHPVDPFLSSWAAHGGNDGADLRLRVYRALALPGPWDRQHLRATLQALLSSGEDQLVLFEREFDSFFSDPVLPDWIVRRLGGEKVDGVEWDPKRALAVICEAAREAKPSRHALPQMKAAWFSEKFHATAPAKARHLRKVLAELHAGSQSVAALAIYSVSIIGVTTTLITAFLYSKQKIMSLMERLRALGLLILTLLGIAIAVLVLLGIAFYLRGQLLRLREGGTGVSRIAPLPPPPDPEPDFRSHASLQPFTEQELDRLSYQIGLTLSDDHAEVDLGGTVNATVRQGGLLEIVRRPSRRVSHLLVVRPAVLDLVTEAMLDSLVAGINRRGVPVKVRCGPPIEDWPDLAIVLVDLSRGAAVLDPPLERWMRAPRMAVIDVREPALWGQEITRLAKPVFPLSYDGVSAALGGETRLTIAYTSSPRRTDAERRLATVLPLAAAAATAEPCDLGTLDQLRRKFTPHLTFHQLQHVLFTDGVTADPCGIHFSSALSRWLRERVGVRFRIEVLRWQAERLKSIKAPAGSRAKKVIEREAVLVKLQILILEAGTAPVDLDQLTGIMADLLDNLASEKERRRARERLQEVNEALPSNSPSSRVLQKRVDSYWGHGQSRPALVHIRPGRFIMGDESNSDVAARAHPVVLTRAFALSVTPITRQQYEQIMGGTPSHYQGSPDLPVESVSFDEAARYCNELSKLEGLTPCYEVFGSYVNWVGNDGYRLPTEAEWEYAARAGQATLYAGSDDPDLVGWYAGNSGKAPQPVGQKAPNMWGLHDMSGNVCEWVWDVYAPYPDVELADPRNIVEWAEIQQRVYRGGSFNLSAQRMRTTNRMFNVPAHRDPSVGFRIARSLPSSATNS